MPDGSALASETTPKNKGGRPLGAESLEKRAKAKADADKLDAWLARWRRYKPPSKIDFERSVRHISPGAIEALRCGW